MLINNNGTCKINHKERWIGMFHTCFMFYISDNVITLWSSSEVIGVGVDEQVDDVSVVQPPWSPKYVADAAELDAELSTEFELGDLGNTESEWLDDE